MPIDHEINYRAIRALADPGGPVERDMQRRGEKVQRVARVLVKKDTRALERRITVRIVRTRGVPAARVGSDLYYSRWVHDGTGIYGPRGTPIVPRQAARLRFFWKRKGRWVTAKSVRGQRGAHYLTRALPAARD